MKVLLRMDTITHIVLGACIGEAVGGKQLGKKSLLIGAIINLVPDLDVVSQLWLDTDEGLLAHRGFTHSFLFTILATILLGVLARRWSGRKDLTAKFWFIFFGAGLSAHILLDSLNAYGTGWFEPFSHQRVSFYALFVADPFYALWLVVACTALLLLKKESSARKYWVRFGLGISSLYLCYCVVNKIRIETEVKTMLIEQHVTYNSHLSTPTPFNNWLWYVVAGNDSGYYTGYYSLFDNKRVLKLHYFLKHREFLETAKDDKELRHLARFSRGFYTLEKWHDTLVFNDLRFGQVGGWYEPGGKFVFHYFLEPKMSNKLVLQRGRFAGWSSDVVNSLVERIEGK